MTRGTRTSILTSQPKSSAGSAPGSPAQLPSFYQQAFERIRSLPGVRAVGAASWIFQPTSRTHALREVEGRPKEPTKNWTALEWSNISGDYFQAKSAPRSL